MNQPQKDGAATLIEMIIFLVEIIVLIFFIGVGAITSGLWLADRIVPPSQPAPVTSTFEFRYNNTVIASGTDFQEAQEWFDIYLFDHIPTSTDTKSDGCEYGAEPGNSGECKQPDDYSWFVDSPLVAPTSTGWSCHIWSDGSITYKNLPLDGSSNGYFIKTTLTPESEGYSDCTQIQ